MKKLTFLFGIAVLAVNLAFSQTVIPNGTEIFGTWTKAGSPYLVNGKAIVPNGKTLTIEPGVVVKFKTGTNLEYESPTFDVGVLQINEQGRLIAEGTKTDSITFTRDGNIGNWGILYFAGGYSENPDSSKLSYCKIQYGSKIIRFFNGKTDQTGALTILGKKKISIRNSTISLNKNTGILIEWVSPMICNNKIISNGEDGVQLRTDSAPYLCNNFISYNSGKGIYNDGSKTGTYIGNIICFNKWGIYEQSEFYTSYYTNSTIYGNQINGIYKTNSFNTGVPSYFINSIVAGNGENFAVSKHISVLNVLTDKSVPVEVKGSNIFITERINFIDTISFKLKSSSPAINSGTLSFAQATKLPIVDIYGNSRIYNDSIDLGAVEFIGDFISFSKPAMGEYLQSGSLEIIEWRSNKANFKLEYSSNAGVNWNTISASINASTYNWQVPSTLKDSCWLRISVIGNQSLADTVSVKVSADNIIGNKELVYGTWYKAKSPYIIEGEAIIPVGKVLNIEPGVIVKFKTGSNFDYATENINAGFLVVTGKLEAVGTESDSICFTRNGSEGNWGSLVILNQVDTLRIDKCIFEYGNVINNVIPDGYFKASMGTVTFFRSNCIVENCSFRNNKERGLYVIRESNCIVRENNFYSNNIGAEIYLGEFGNDLTSVNIFNDNNIGLQISSKGKVEKNNFTNNKESGIRTTYKTKISENRVNGNNYGISGSPAWGNLVINNKILNNDYGIYFTKRVLQV
jgi:parallel beta-helix repeat protein